jgi:hypothetical protein
MKKDYLRAYATTVTAHGMFKAVSEIPLHGSFQSYDAIGSLNQNVIVMSNEDLEASSLIKKHRELIALSSFFGQALTEELAFAFEKENLLELDAFNTTKKHLISFLRAFSKEELNDVSKIIESIQSIK